jgi:methionine synthase reductase
MAVKQFTIIYASQTGQAKSIAENISDLASQRNFKTNLFCISEYEKRFHLNSLNEPVVFVISTTGDGETPETATRCYSKLRSKALPKNFLENLHYTLLGLGSTMKYGATWVLTSI